MFPKNEKSIHRGLVVLISILLVVTIFALYLQTRNHPFVFDDDSYIVQNKHVISGITGENIVWAFTSTHSANWHPITWLSHMADVQMYGLNPGGHHLTNIVFHSLSTLLLLLLLLRLTGSLWKSAFVSALFALHPLRVESVAWVAERKDVLSALFGFLTLIIYSEYTAIRKMSLYFCALITFVLGLMSKQMLVTIPILMLLIDFWPLDRFDNEKPNFFAKSIVLLREKLPFFACSLLTGIITISVQYKSGSVGSLKALPLVFRIENAMTAYVKYMLKIVFPQDLAILYPLPHAFPLWQVVGSLLILLTISAIVIRFRQHFPYLIMGWFWFLITLLPVIGLIQVGDQAIADRYTYIPAVGLFIIVSWGAADLTRWLPYRRILITLFAGAIIITFFLLTWHQLGFWRDSVSLYRHTLHVAPGSSIIHNNLGNILFSRGQLDAALQEYRNAIIINPDNANYHNNFGAVLDEKGYIDGAILEFQKALEIRPYYTEAMNNLGLALSRKGNVDAAIIQYQKALQTNADYVIAHYNLGIAYVDKGSWDDAIREFQITIRLNPNYADAHLRLKMALARKLEASGAQND